MRDPERQHQGVVGTKGPEQETKSWGDQSSGNWPRGTKRDVVHSMSYVCRAPQGRRLLSEGSTPVTRPFPAIRHPRGVSHTECGFSSLSLTQSCMAKSLCIWFCAPGEVGSYLGLVGTCSARSGKARSMATCTGCCLARLISTWEGHHLTHTHTPIVILAKVLFQSQGCQMPKRNK